MSAILRAVVIVVAASAALGCTNSCKPGTALVSFRLNGDAATADTLQVEVDVGGQSRISTIPLGAGKLEGSVEVDFASGYPAAGQTLSVGIVALHDGVVVGSGVASTSIMRSCTNLTVPVEGGDVLADLAAESSDMSERDLATTPCAPASGMQSSQCPGALPICGSDGACRACVLNTECTLGVCKSDGTCAVASEIEFVDNAGGNCTGTAHAGTQADPYCEIQDAIDAANPLRFVHVGGSAVPYHSIFVGNETNPINVTVVGPAIFTGTSAAEIHDTDKSAVTLAVTGSLSFSVAIDGMVIYGGVQTVTNRGVDCRRSGTGSASMTILRSSITNAAGIGVFNAGCALVVDRSTIAANIGGGFETSDGSYVITNSFIVNNGNGGSGPGAAIASAATGTAVFAFDTVANNVNGGISCPNVGTSVNIQSSIVVGNTQTAGSQIAGKCVLQNVVTGTDSFAGAIQLTPTFATGSRYLAPNDAANKACCVDKVNGATTPNGDHDVDFSHRPKGAAWDIGAHEVE